MDTPNFYVNKLKVHNFKNFLDVDVDLDRFNVVIGQNATGKSNFKNIFFFLTNIVYDGISSALSIHGGSDQVLNFHSKDNLLSFELHFSSYFPERIKKLGEHTKLNTTKIVYKFCIELTRDTNDYVIIEDKLILYSYTSDNPHNTCKLILSKDNKEINFTKISDKTEVIIEKRPDILEYFRTDKKRLLIQESLLYQILPNWDRFIHTMATYDLEPNILKLPTSINNFSTLSKDGSNLAYILEHIKKNKEQKDEFLNYIQNLLPFLKTFSTNRHNGKVQFNLQEISSDKNIPALFVSDGTVNVIALLICTFFEDSLLSVINEPERNIHPSLLNKIIELVNVASEYKQIIITTHNTDIAEHVPIKNVLLISRDEQGISTLVKLEDHEMFKKFNDVGIRTLLRQELLS